MQFGIGFIVGPGIMIDDGLLLSDQYGIKSGNAGPVDPFCTITCSRCFHIFPDLMYPDQVLMINGSYHNAFSGLFNSQPVTNQLQDSLSDGAAGDIKGAGECGNTQCCAGKQWYQPDGPMFLQVRTEGPRCGYQPLMRPQLSIT